jgi:hypothetical protein
MSRMKFLAALGLLALTGTAVGAGEKEAGSAPKPSVGWVSPAPEPSKPARRFRLPTILQVGGLGKSPCKEEVKGAAGPAEAKCPAEAACPKAPECPAVKCPKWSFAGFGHLRDWLCHQDPAPCCTCHRCAPCCDPPLYAFFLDHCRCGWDGPACRCHIGCCKGCGRVTGPAVTPLPPGYKLPLPPICTGCGASCCYGK